MTLTPADIEQKTFSTALRGYNLDEVDDFLDEIVRTMRKLHEELDESRATPPPAPVVKPVETPPPPPPPPVPVTPPPIDESAVGKALIAAQETAERIVSDAKEEAQQIVATAQTEADSFEENRQRRREQAEGEISRLDALVERVKAELAELSAAVGVDLSHMSGSVEQAVAELDEDGDDPSDEKVDAAEPDESETGTAETIVDSDGPALYDQDEYEFDDKAASASAGVPDELGDDSGDDGEEGAADGEGEKTVEAEIVGDDEEDESESDDYFHYPDGDDDDEEPTRP